MYVGRASLDFSFFATRIPAYVATVCCLETEFSKQYRLGDLISCNNNVTKAYERLKAFFGWQLGVSGMFLYVVKLYM